MLKSRGRVLPIAWFRCNLQSKSQNFCPNGSSCIPTRALHAEYTYANVIGSWIFKFHITPCSCKLCFQTFDSSPLYNAQLEHSERAHIRCLMNWNNCCFIAISHDGGWPRRHVMLLVLLVIELSSLHKAQIRRLTRKGILRISPYILRAWHICYMRRLSKECMTRRWQEV